ncbi:YgaP family membrane protein [Halorhabdus rudnickae]|uniref:YgaP family membrane protein n=1 Tax=Halorhabdus rudnickae TaxID=1775544 RepID=UPI0010830D1C|nr:DUF2892 domain-containing protein [Halorhabdus rudnickae]
MEQNVGSVDRTVRIVAGLVLGAVGLAVLAGFLSALGTVIAALALVVGVVLLGTALTRQCLLYELVGIDTRE